MWLGQRLRYLDEPTPFVCQRLIDANLPLPPRSDVVVFPQTLLKFGFRPFRVTG